MRLETKTKEELILLEKILQKNVLTFLQHLQYCYTLNTTTRRGVNVLNTSSNASFLQEPDSRDWEGPEGPIPAPAPIPGL